MYDIFAGGSQLPQNPLFPFKETAQPGFGPKIRPSCLCHPSLFRQRSIGNLHEPFRSDIAHILRKISSKNQTLHLFSDKTDQLSDDRDIRSC